MSDDVWTCYRYQRACVCMRMRTILFIQVDVIVYIPNGSSTRFQSLGLCFHGLLAYTIFPEASGILYFVRVRKVEYIRCNHNNNYYYYRVCCMLHLHRRAKYQFCTRAKRRTSIEPNIARIYDEKKTFFRKKEMDAAQKPEKIAFNGKS